MDKILPVYKPVGMTSFDVIREFKRAVHPDYKVGHGGTLDPFADGVLLLLLGKATKRMNELSALPKTYRATAILGAKSDTLDRTGVITSSRAESRPACAGRDPSTAARLAARQVGMTNELINSVISQFVGRIEQEIPDYSATKINGVPRYKLARRGEVMEKKSKLVQIYDIRITKIEKEKVEFVATVSSGTYIRQLSYDIFKSLGIESYLESLTRTQIGDFSLEKCVAIEDLPAQTGMEAQIKRLSLGG